jgi:hypothetical protein
MFCDQWPSGSAVPEVRRQKNVKVIVRQRAPEWCEADLLQQDVTRRISQYLFLDPIAAVTACVPDAVSGHAGGQLRGFGDRIALFFRKETLPIGHDESEVADTGRIDAWIVDLVDDPVT